VGLRNAPNDAEQATACARRCTCELGAGEAASGFTAAAEHALELARVLTLHVGERRK
jgi:hypothetical protein